MLGLYDHILAATGGPTHQDGLLSYFLANGAVSNNLVDAEYEFLIAGGASPSSISDMWYDFLIIQGYTGSVPDMYYDYWAGTTPPPPIAIPGYLTGGIAPLPANTDLTALGDLAWKHWGEPNLLSVNEKNNGASVISGITPIGDVLKQYTDTRSIYAWTDGTPIASISGVTTGVYVSGLNNGYSFTATADTTVRRLVVHIAGFRSETQITVTMSGINAPPPYTVSFEDFAGPHDRELTLDYLSQDDGELITIQVLTIQDPSTFANSALPAAYMTANVSLPPNQQEIVIPSDIAAFDYISSVSVSTDGSRMVMGAPNANPDTITDAGAVWAYVISGGNYVGEQKLIAPDKLPGDNFGNLARISGDGSTLAISAHNQDTDQIDGGAVYIWELIATTWTYKYRITQPVPVAAAKFGFSIALSDDGSTLVVGEPFIDLTGIELGEVYVFDITGGTPVQLAVLSHLVLTDFDRHGYSVEISGDGNTIFTAALTVGGAGEVRVYRKSGSWVDATEDQNFKPVPSASGDFFGTAVPADGSPVEAYSGRCLASSANGIDLFVGAYGVNGVGTDRGAVYHFKDIAGTMTQQQTITASQFDQDNNTFGYAVSCNSAGTKVVIGAQSNDSPIANAGRIYTYTFNGTIFVISSTNVSDSPQVAEFLGYAVSISGDGSVMSVVATGYDQGADTDTGAVYSFTVV